MEVSVKRGFIMSRILRNTIDAVATASYDSLPFQPLTITLELRLFSVRANFDGTALIFLATAIDEPAEAL